MVETFDLLEVYEKMSCGIGSSQSSLDSLLPHHVATEINDSWIICITIKEMFSETGKSCLLKVHLLYRSKGNQLLEFDISGDTSSSLTMYSLNQITIITLRLILSTCNIFFLENMDSTMRGRGILDGFIVVFKFQVQLITAFVCTLNSVSKEQKPIL